MIIIYLLAVTHFKVNYNKPKKTILSASKYFLIQILMVSNIPI